MTRVVVFAGPSARSDEIKELAPLHLEVLPPARRGDVLAVARERPAATILLDGLMVHEYPPSPNELVEASQFTALWGASSLGALRAVELREHGMRGVGWIYAAFMSGAIDADDELVTPVDPRDHHVTAVPLVRLRYAVALWAGGTAGRLSRGAELIRLTKQRYFADRLLDQIADDARKLGVPATVVQSLTERSTDIKRADSLECIAVVLHELGVGSAVEPIDHPGTPERGGGHSPLRRKLASRLNQFGITRIADTSGMDITGIATHAAVRPGTSDSISVYSGKGLDDEASYVSAVMECVERTSALWPQKTAGSLVASEAEAAWDGEVWGPGQFTERSTSVTGALEWVDGLRLQSGTSVRVPAEMVFLGAAPLSRGVERAFRVRTSNGLGAGFTREYAVRRALYELIERDVVSCAELSASHFAFAMLSGMGRLVGREPSTMVFQDDTRFSEVVTEETLPADALSVLRRFETAGLEVHVRHLPNDFGVPTFAALAIEEVTPGKFLGAAGYRSDLCANAAVLGALLELAQSRSTDLQGSREDTDDSEKRRLVSAPDDHWLLAGGDRYPGPIVTSTPRESSVEITELIGRLSSVGLEEVAVVDLPSPAETYVVRVLVPGIETWHPTGGLSDLGPRLSRRLGGDKPTIGRTK